MATDPMYPVSVNGQLDANLSRWLWLVKLLLIIPHAIALFFLWIAFSFLTIVVFFAILFTGKYPRGIFDFNVGVLRWSWRVMYYSNGAFATDKYPPFSLSTGDYPANLEIEYPEQLSRGLVLIKWWLLTIPHYWVVSIISNLGTALALIAALALLVTGRYPREMFELVLGFNRWRLRVTAYAALMRDEYPPFRLGE